MVQDTPRKKSLQLHLHYMQIYIFQSSVATYAMRSYTLSANLDSTF
jgi:hypothetical protein